MASYLWRKYADYLYYKWEKTILWDMLEPYRRPKSFTPLVTLYIFAFYTGVIGSAITEQLYKVFLMHAMNFCGYHWSSCASLLKLLGFWHSFYRNKRYMVMLSSTTFVFFVDSSEQN